MKHTPTYALVLAGSTLLVSTLLVAAPAGQSAAPVAQSAAPAPAPAAADPRNGLFVRVCNDCHDAARIVSLRRTMPDWEDVLNKMIEKGAVGSGDDFESIFGYLLLNYGKVYINTAKATEITKILGLSKKDADAIVAYRTANGNFTDVDAIKKVPGIDVKILEEHKDAIAFDAVPL